MLQPAIDLTFLDASGEDASPEMIGSSRLDFCWSLVLQRKKQHIEKNKKKKQKKHNNKKQQYWHKHH